METGETKFAADRDLARRAAENDAAFEEIVARHGRLVYTVALRSAVSPEDASDIAQETFFKAWRSLAAYRGECALSTWLCRIALSCACDFARSKKRHATVSLTVPDGEGEEDRVADIPLTDGAALPEDAIVRAADIRAVQEAIAALPEEYRMIVMLRDMGDMPYGEIAETLGLELGTVKSRLHRARAAVKEFLLAGNFFGEMSSNGYR